MEWIVTCVIFLLPLVFSSYANAISSTEVCRVCEGCLYGSISCQEAGKLQMIPNDLPLDIKKVIIVGQRFQSQLLQRRNISSYSQSNMSIEQLTLMDCGLRSIEERAFYGLKSLTKLDISKNTLTRIQRLTFAGLRLEQLRLDENMGLTLAPGAFENLTVNSLSMQNCGLRSLTFADMEPLIRTGMLTTLRLTGNSLTTLDASFESLFLTLKAISLSQNPFNCDCQLVWLTRVLQRKHRDAEPEISRLPVVLDDFPLNDEFATSSAIYPICDAPKRLRKRKLIALISEDFFCSPPLLNALEISFDSSEIVEVGRTNSTYAQLKCSARGSPELQLGWYRRQSGAGSGLIFERVPGSKIISPGVVELILYHQPAQEATQPNSELLTCLGVDTYGNTSADISLTWPLAKPIPTPSTVVPLSGDGSLSAAGDSRLEVLETSKLHDFFFRKKFTILELFGAVLGTFTVTITLFLLGYCLLYNRGKIHKKNSHCLLRENSGVQSQNADISSQQKVIGYSIVTSNKVPLATTTTAYFPLETITNVACSAGRKEKDGGKSKLTVYGGAYDPIVGNGSTYSEFPTYDLPQCHMPGQDQQAAPLPAIPSNETPSQPSQSSSENDCRYPLGDLGKRSCPTDIPTIGYARSLYGDPAMSTISGFPHASGIDAIMYPTFNHQTLLVASQQAHNQSNPNVLAELLAQQRLLQTNLEAAQFNHQRVPYGL